MKKDNHIRINLWSGPRNISTALMYSFAQRSDCQVYDEPLYGFYLDQTAAAQYHPGGSEVLAQMELDGSKVLEMMAGAHKKEVVFFKQMTHHLLDLDKGFLEGMVNVILTRNPIDMLPSFAKEIPNPQMNDVGYAAHLSLLKSLEAIGREVIVLDAERVQNKPSEVLLLLCEKIGIPFEPAMLSWPQGARKEDGPWAKYWYENVHASTSFKPYQAKTAPFPEELMPLLDECLPIYRTLRALAI